MRIVYVAPNANAVPPRADDGTEQMIHELSEEMARRGHDVILFAPAGSWSSGKVICYPAGLTDIGHFVRVKLPDSVDLIHDHTFGGALSGRFWPCPVVHTNHLAEQVKVVGYEASIYVSQRALQIVGGGSGDCVYNGIDTGKYQFSEAKKDYLLFMGSIIREKGILEAIEIAQRTDKELVIAGPKHDHELFAKEIMPILKKNSNISYAGPVRGQEKQDLLKNASYLVFPSKWEEPFGIVMLEAMACGTPVIALSNGAVPEVLRGLPHSVCSSVDEMVNKIIHGIPEVHSQQLREYVETNFTVTLMADRYEKIYDRVIHERVERGVDGQSAPNDDLREHHQRKSSERRKRRHRRRDRHLKSSSKRRVHRQKVIKVRRSKKKVSRRKKVIRKIRRLLASIM